MSLVGLHSGIWTQAPDSAGVTLTTSATAFTKSAYVQITPGLKQAAFGLQYHLYFADGPTVDFMYFVDIAFGASGSEVVVVRDYPAGFRNYNTNYGSGILPIAIPANVRVSMRVSSSAAGAQVVNVFPQMQYASPLSPAGASICTVIGLTNPVTSLAGGATLTSTGTTGQFGTAVQYSAAVPHTVRAIRAVVMSAGTTNFRSRMLRLSADSAGANVLGPAICTSDQGGSLSDMHIPNTEIFPCQIAKGSPLYLATAALVGGTAGTSSFALHLFG